MAKPHLEIESEDNDPVLKGKCSACADVTFSLSRDTESALAVLHGMFSAHVQKVHGRDKEEPSRSPSEG